MKQQATGQKKIFGTNKYKWLLLKRFKEYLQINMKRVKKGIRSSQKTILEWPIENSETGMTFIEH